jgi:renalase
MTTRLDHGAIGFTANGVAFQAFAYDAIRAGCLAEWRPQLASGSESLTGGNGFFAPAPDMASLVRHLLNGITASWSFATSALVKSPAGWKLRAGDVLHESAFDRVVLAIPPAQTAPLINPYRDDWARHASLVPMQPYWALMGIADNVEGKPRWDAARPIRGPLEWVVRNDSRPGRAAVAGQAHWVAHARASWNRHHDHGSHREQR